MPAEWTEWILMGFPFILPFILLLLIWPSILILIAKFSGWQELYRALGSHASPQVIGSTSKNFRFVTGALNKTRYKNCLTVKTSRYALMLRVFPLLGIGHKPLVIPWEKIASITPQKRFLLRTVQIKLKTPLKASIELPESLFVNNSHLPNHLALHNSDQRHENPYQ